MRGAVERTLGPLGRNARQVLDLVAVAGPGVGLQDLRNATVHLQPSLSSAELFTALDHCLWSGVLLEDDDSYALRHALVRMLLLEDLPRHRRIELSTALAHADTTPCSDCRWPAGVATG